MRLSISFVLLTLAVIASSEVKARPSNLVARRNLGSLQEPHLVTRCDSCGSQSADASTYSGSGDSKGATAVDSTLSTSDDDSSSGSTPYAETQAATKDDTSAVNGEKAQAAETASTGQAGETTQADNKVVGTDNTGAAAQTLDSQNSQNTSSSKTTPTQSAANTVPVGVADQKSESTPDTQQTAGAQITPPEPTESTQHSSNNSSNAKPDTSTQTTTPVGGQDGQTAGATLDTQQTTGTQSAPSGGTDSTQPADKTPSATQSGGSTSISGGQDDQHSQKAINTSTTNQFGDTTRSYQGLVQSCQQLVPGFIRFTQIVSQPDVDHSSAVREFDSLRSRFGEIVKTYSSCGGGCAQNQDLGVFHNVLNQLIGQFSGWIAAFGRWNGWSAALQPHWQTFCNSLEDFVRLSRSIGINTGQVFRSYNLSPTTLQGFQINAVGFF